MEDYKKRMIEENNQLCERITKLEKFIKAKEFNEKVSNVNVQELMKAQLAVMKSYQIILNARIIY
jgi:hypothetical protein